MIYWMKHHESNDILMIYWWYWMNWFLCSYYSFHAAPMLLHCFLCCYHSFHWYSNGSFMLHQWYYIGSFAVIIYHSFHCYSIGSFMLHQYQWIPLIPLHYHWFNWYSFAVIIDSCCINGIFHWVLCIYHSFHAHSMLCHWIQILMCLIFTQWVY